MKPASRLRRERKLRIGNCYITRVAFGAMSLRTETRLAHLSATSCRSLREYTPHGELRIHGLDLQAGSAATIKGSFTSSQNQGFGINVNGSSLTFTAATAAVSGNAVGVQRAASANLSLNDSQTVLNANNNSATGVTVLY